jgi:glycosyltransferase 2 family protein
MQINTKNCFKSLLHLSGIVLAILSIAFVALRLHNYSTSLDFTQFDTKVWSYFFLLALIYAISCILLSYIWWNLLKHFGVCVSERWVYQTYGKSQLAKYIPGNIFHLAGRQALSIAAGLQGWAVAKSTFWELGFSAIAGTLLAVLAIPLKWPTWPEAVSIAALLGLFMMAGVLVYRFFSRSACIAFCWQITFLMITGSIFVGVLAIVSPAAVTVTNFPELCGAYVAAWLAGLVTPGSPAGMGVREVILLFLLKGLLPENDLLVAVVVSRLITIAGDLLYFILANCIPKTKSSYYGCEIT